jgi:hypothetical protein
MRLRRAKLAHPRVPIRTAQSGYKTRSRYRKHGNRLMPELYDFLNPTRTQGLSKEAERELTALLREQGMHVYLGQ